MTDPDATPDPDPTPDPDIDQPLAVKAENQRVIIGGPDQGETILTADAAEVSGIRLLDAAAEARKRF